MSQKRSRAERKRQRERTEEIQATVQRAAERAERYYTENIEPKQVDATERYRGDLYGDELANRSKVTTTEIRDATLAQLPSLMRIFFGPEHAVEFTVTEQDGVPLEVIEQKASGAEQQTSYIEYVIREDNDGFLQFYSAFKDALVRRTGIFKWWWDESYRVQEIEYERLSVRQLEQLIMDDDVLLLPETLVNVAPGLYDVRVQYRKKFGCPKFGALPPDELYYTPGSRALKQAPFVFHSRRVPLDVVVALGYSREEIEELLEVDENDAESDDELQFVRNDDDSADDRWYDDEDALDSSQRPILFTEAWGLVDGDDDDIAELRMFHCVGSDYVILNGEGRGQVISELPIAIGTPDPEPHTIAGLSNYDILEQNQRVKTQILRGTLDSLTQALNPVLEVVQGQVNMQDVLNPDVANVVRVRAPGMLREVKHQFVGGDTIPMLQYMDELRENSTGTSKAAAGLNADALQSATKAAVSATLSGSQQRIELIAYVLAETLVKPLFKGLYRLCVEHQDRERIVRLRGKYVEIDPRTWDAEMDVTVNVGLGYGTPEDRIALMTGVVERLELYIKEGVPFANYIHLRKALGRALKMAGIRNEEELFGNWGMQEQQQYDQAKAQQPPPQDPIVEIEKMKVQLQAQAAQMKHQLDSQTAQRDAQREDAELQRDTQRQQAELQIKELELVGDERRNAQLARDEQQKMAIDREQALAKLNLEREVAFAKLALEREFKQAELELEREKMSIEREKIAMQREVAQQKASQQSEGSASE